MEQVGRPQAAYNPAVHGPYNPGTWYGKPDTKLSEVKLAELPAWLSRRSKNPVDWVRAGSRAMWRWHRNWFQVRNPTGAPVIQLMVGLSTFYYIMQYKAHKNERIAKYH